MRWDKTNVRYLRFITLTTETADVDQVAGRMEELWHRIRARWPHARYFWKLELQARGAPHYHLFWLNAPKLSNGFTLKWLSEAWGLGFVHERRIPGSVWKRSGAGYLRSYLKKHGVKGYQEDYSSVPSYIRTFGSHVKGYDAKELDAHVSRWEVVYDGAALVLTARLEHGPGNRCSAPLGTAERAAARRREKEGRRLARLWTGHSGQVEARSSVSARVARGHSPAGAKGVAWSYLPGRGTLTRNPEDVSSVRPNLFTGVAMTVASSALTA